MINQQTKNKKILFISLLLGFFVFANLSSSEEAIKYDNHTNFDINSELVSDAIDPLCNGISYSQLSTNTLYRVSNMDINFINKASWYENLLSVIKDVDYIYESRKKRFKAEVKVYYEDGSFCSFPSEIRISGDHQDHIRKTNLAASLDVHLKNGNIGNIVKFKLFLPETRNNDIELVASSIMNKLGFLTPRTYKVNVSLNNQEKIEYIFQEKIVKEMIEHKQLRESALLETSEDFFWENRQLLNENKPVLFAKLLNTNWVNRTPYNKQIGIESLDEYNKIIFQSEGSYLIYDYIENPKLQKFDTAILAFDGHHGLAIHNRKFYYDKLRNELIPIYYDIDSQIENRDLYIKKCDEELLNQYEKFICINNFAEGAIKLLRDIDFESKDIKLDLEQKNININDEYIENVFNKFIENLENISKISSKDNTFTNQHISNFKMNYLNNTLNSAIGFYFYNFDNKFFEFCTSNLDKCVQKNIEIAKIDSPLVVDDVSYYFLGSKKTIGNSSQETKEVSIDKNVFIKNMGASSKIFIDSKNKLVDIKLGKKSKIFIHGTGVLKSWNINIVGNKDEVEDNFRQDSNLLTGCVTFFGIEIYDIEISSKNNMCEDAINLLNVKGFIRDINIINSHFDGLDIDFSNLEIQDINIENSGNDCLDISSSILEIDTFYSNNCVDKSLSIGEKSTVKITTFESLQSNIAIAVKDSSNVIISNKLGIENDMCIAMYRKKQEFGPSYLKIENYLCDGKSENFIQYGQELVVDN